MLGKIEKRMKNFRKHVYAFSTFSLLFHILTITVNAFLVTVLTVFLHRLPTKECPFDLVTPLPPPTRKQVVVTRCLIWSVLWNRKTPIWSVSISILFVDFVVRLNKRVCALYPSEILWEFGNTCLCLLWPLIIGYCPKIWLPSLF